MSKVTTQFGESNVAIKWVGLLSALLTTVILYQPTLGYYWVGEDFDWAVKKDWSAVLGFFSLSSEANFYRPISWSSFALDAALWGDNPLMWRVESLILNLICVALVWLLADRLRGAAVAALAAILYAINPAHPGAVTWITARPDLLSTLFCLTCVVLFIRHMQTRQRRYYNLAIVALLLGILCKETALVLPAVLIMADLLFFDQPGVAASTVERWRIEWRTRIRAMFWRHLPFIAVGGGYLLLRLLLNAQGLLTFGYGAQRAPASMVRNVAGDLAMLLGGPNSQFDDVAAAAIIFGFVVISLGMAYWAGRLAWLGLAWLTITLLPVFGIAVIEQDARYVYLPSVGLALMLAAALGKWMQQLFAARDRQLATVRWRTLPATLLLVMLLVYGGYGTVVHNQEWGVASDITVRYLAQIKAAHPTVPPNSRFYLIGRPIFYQRATLFLLGIANANALRMTYADYSLKAYFSYGGRDYFETALSQPSAAPAYYFRYADGGLIEYPTAAALMQYFPAGDANAAP